MKNDLSLALVTKRIERKKKNEFPQEICRKDKYKPGFLKKCKLEVQTRTQSPIQFSWTNKAKNNSFQNQNVRLELGATEHF